MRGDRRVVCPARARVHLELAAAALAPVTVQTPFGHRDILIMPLFALAFSQVGLPCS